jgi:hypothetical protein
LLAKKKKTRTAKNAAVRTSRPKGKTKKDYAREVLECMTEEERQEFRHGLSRKNLHSHA